MQLHIRQPAAVTTWCISALLAVLATTICTQSCAQVHPNPIARIMDNPAIPAIEKKDHLARLGEEQVPALLDHLKKNPDSWNRIVPALGAIGDA